MEQKMKYYKFTPTSPLVLVKLIKVKVSPETMEVRVDNSKWNKNQYKSFIKSLEKLAEEEVNKLWQK